MANTKSKSASSAAAEPADELEAQPVSPKEIDPDQYVIVRNGFHGKLIYKSSRTGEKYVWSDFGDEQEMSLRELRNAKNSKKSFLINNWFMFDEPWIIDYLGVRKYYKHAMKIDDFDNIFSKTPAQIEKIVSELSSGQRRSLIYRTTELIASGEIDSRKVIQALENALNVELVER